MEMRSVDKRPWVCTKLGCPMAQRLSSALCPEVPVDKKCPLCHSAITILAGGPDVVGCGIMEIPSCCWQCESCRRIGLMEKDRAPAECPHCGGKIISVDPVVKSEPLGDGLEVKY